jgi:Tol biopolymer transport system component
MRIRLVCACAALVLAGSASASTVRVSVGNGGEQSTGFSGGAAVSADARYVAFNSSAANLVVGDTNGKDDVFVRDVVAGTTERVSLTSSGGESNGSSFLPDISDDGRYVAFMSFATNFSPPGAPLGGNAHMFLRDRLLGTTQQLDVAPGGDTVNSGGCCPSISANGHTVAFESTASDVVPGPDVNFADIYVRNVVAGTTMRASTDASGNQVLGGPFASSFSPDLSADAGRVAFSSSLALVPADTNGVTDVYVKSIASGAIVRASVDGAGNERLLSSGGAEISGDGNLVVFTSSAAFVPEDANGFADVYVRDLAAGTTRRITDGNNHSSGQDVSPNGRYVVLQSDATNLVPGDTNGKADIFVADLMSGDIRRASVADDGAQSNNASFEGVATNAGAAAFGSSADNLVAGDTNGKNDVFLNTPNLAPVCSALSLSPTSLWPANHKFVPVEVTGASDPDGDSLTFTYVVTQDEPVNGSGDGDTAPDAQVVNGKLELRAERSGGGDGRVYRVAVTVSDGQASCTETLTVSVPHDPKQPAVAGAESFDSFGT